MYRIRLHGRGGQGLKTAGRVLGSALFRQGFEVQDAPRYGAERRGAPISAYVRASRSPVRERGVISAPDLVIVADESLMAVPAAGVREGVGERTVLLIASARPAAEWQERSGVPGPVYAVADPSPTSARGATLLCVGAGARMLGVVGWPALEAALRDELDPLGGAAVASGLSQVRDGFEQLAEHAGRVAEGPERVPVSKPADWIVLEREPVRSAAPDVYAGITSVEVRTGLWRTMRPVIDYEHCNRCSWMCATQCPDSAIRVDADRTPHIDYEHCKGCMVCVSVCPPHAISLVPEQEAASLEERSLQEKTSGRAPGVR